MSNKITGKCLMGDAVNIDEIETIIFVFKRQIIFFSILFKSSVMWSSKICPMLHLSII